MVVIEFLFLLLGVGLAGTAVVLAFTKREKPEASSTTYAPPTTHPGEPLQHVRMSGISVLWTELGQPRKIGTQAEINMKSGAVGIYELRNIEPTTTDWSWYDFEFLRYKHPAAGPQDGPATSG